MQFIKIISNKPTDRFLKFCQAAAQSHLGCIILIQTKMLAVEMKKKYDVAVNHESIHIAQARELLVLFWYILYAGHFLVLYIPRLIKGIVTRNDLKKIFWDSYGDIVFEKEAYAHEKDLGYLEKRKRFACFRILQNT